MLVPFAALNAAASMWNVLNNNNSNDDDADPLQSQLQAFRTIFGDQGERGEYMDGYPPKAMLERCTDDYGWDDQSGSSNDIAAERDAMMAHLYDNQELWEHVSMVAFSEHYVLGCDNENDNQNQSDTKQSHETFRRQKEQQPMDRPIFGGVVLKHWEEESIDNNDNDDDDDTPKTSTTGFEEKLVACGKQGIDYIRLECNLGSVQDIGEPNELSGNPRFGDRFGRLAKAAKLCQTQGMVPLVLLQMPWREQNSSLDYFEHGIKGFATALTNEGVDPGKLLLETRPPIGLSAQDETELTASERIILGFRCGLAMFHVLNQNFESNNIAGFCVAGGSTKGQFPTAMEDDTQNAVRQGLRESALRKWGVLLCFWEMGAKLMLQPAVGKLWGDSKNDDARDLFYTNAKHMADELKL